MAAGFDGNMGIFKLFEAMNQKNFTLVLIE